MWVISHYSSIRLSSELFFVSDYLLLKHIYYSDDLPTQRKDTLKTAIRLSHILCSRAFTFFPPFVFKYYFYFNKKVTLKYMPTYQISYKHLEFKFVFVKITNYIFELVFNLIETNQSKLINKIMTYIGYD